MHLFDSLNYNIIFDSLKRMHLFDSISNRLIGNNYGCILKTGTNQSDRDVKYSDFMTVQAISIFIRFEQLNF
jgi:hypothetical protein